MHRLFTHCAASLLLYVIVFGVILDRPLALGLPRTLIERALARGATLDSPKLIILAGSNGPYSHRCEVIEPIIAMPCVNAGVAVGIGLDYLFARWQPLLRPGDIVYLPLEEAQYTRIRAAITTGPDAAIMLRHDRATLAALPPDRWFGALFAFDPRFVLMAVLETALASTGFHDPRAEAIGTTNAWGDHTGHTTALAAANAAGLSTATPHRASATAITGGDGTRLVRDFLMWARTHDIQVIGGFSTGFADVPPPEAAATAIRAIYAPPSERSTYRSRPHRHGPACPGHPYQESAARGGPETPGHDDEGQSQSRARFLELPNRSLYPRSAFFDTPDHLHEAAQIIHSRQIAIALRTMFPPIDVPVSPSHDDETGVNRLSNWRQSSPSR